LQQCDKIATLSYMATVDAREALKQKYREERDKRLRAEGNDQ
jgi:hypothetical protein